MQWERKSTMGLIQEPYRVGKFRVEDHLKYRVWFNAELLGDFPTFEECEKAVAEHQKEVAA